MKTRSIAVAAVAATAPVAAVMLARAARGRRTAGEAAVLPAGQITWQALPNAPAGVEYCPLWGETFSGPHGAFTKFPPGFAVPLHTHSGSGRMVVVSGAFLYTPEGQPTVRLGPGSYFEQRSNARHTSAADPIEGCVFYHEQDRGFDLRLVETSPVIH